jgi:DNA repair protein RadC
MTQKERNYIQKEMYRQQVSEIGIHYISKGSKIQMITSLSVYEKLFDWWSNTINITESFAIMLLNRINNEIGIFEVSRGSMVGTVIDTKLICAVSILSGASKVVCCHNHPSGNLNPSDADIKITNKTKETLSIMDIDLLDHLIIIPERSKYFSFADEGLI